MGCRMDRFGSSFSAMAGAEFAIIAPLAAGVCSERVRPYRNAEGASFRPETLRQQDGRL
jgi:hypothetical protein